jgi:hypothetical protein
MPAHVLESDYWRGLPACLPNIPAPGLELPVRAVLVSTEGYSTMHNPQPVARSPLGLVDVIPERSTGKSTGIVHTWAITP